tara:strand:+ start:2065 stop:2646 length:582 start_codon:yes stop_codon:yes gene_type:complete
MNKVMVPRDAVSAVLKQTGKYIKPTAESRLTKEFNIIKQQMMSEFNNHPITKELDEKTSADPSAFVGDGSLFGFIGFSAGDEPTLIVREMLNSSQIKFVRIKGELVDFRVIYPTKEELFQATPLPWAAGRSWLRGIEVGLSGLGKYLNIESGASRSGGGIQANNNVRSGRFRNTKYISQILNNFIKKVENLSL